jgi:hypothetical protein
VSESRVQNEATGKAATLPFLALPRVETIGSAVTSLAIILSGMLYLSGWEERHKLLREFGLTNLAFEESLQSTLARGYRPLLMGLLSTVVIVAGVWLLGKGFERLGGSRTAVRFNRAYIAALLAVAVLTCAYMAGNESGLLRAQRLADQVLARQCLDHDCFSYRLVRERYLGVVVAQDPQRTALLTRHGLVLLRTNDIVAVVPDFSVSRKTDAERRGWPFRALFRE